MFQVIQDIRERERERQRERQRERERERERKASSTSLASSPRLSKIFYTIAQKYPSQREREGGREGGSLGGTGERERETY